MQSTVVEVNRERVFGLSSTDASSSYTSIQYAFHLLNTGSLQVYESGVSRGLFGTYAASDVLKIAVENSIVKYYQNGTLLYISAVTPTLPLYVDVCTRAVGATVWDESEQRKHRHLQRDRNKCRYKSFLSMANERQ
ncbi:MAG: hypothetical protein IPP38_08240 [Bacteroidetes bacterium]|nr:hypothetical protein [Bacteroidota bacterium]